VTDDERAILRFEELRPRNDRTKEAWIRTEFGISPTRYFQRLHRLVARPDVLEEFALVAHRVQRTIDLKVALRAERRFA
jgi:hypothetical protein